MIKSAATLQQGFAYRKLPLDLPVSTSDYESHSDTVANEHAHTFSSLQTFESCQLSVWVLRWVLKVTSLTSSRFVRFSAILLEDCCLKSGEN